MQVSTPTFQLSINTFRPVDLEFTALGDGDVCLKTFKKVIGPNAIEQAKRPNGKPVITIDLSLPLSTKKVEMWLEGKKFLTEWKLREVGMLQSFNFTQETFK
jgi:hypothetical protein